VVLYHHDCPKCLEAIPRYEDQVQQAANDPAAPRVALIEVPPFGTEALPTSPDTPCVLGRLSDEKEWFVETPAVLLLHDGAVSPMNEVEAVPPVETVNVASEAAPEAEPFCVTCEQAKIAAMDVSLGEGR
jgi:hypothetical protein